MIFGFGASYNLETHFSTEENFLVEECIESDFGFWAAINLLNPQKIRSIYAATIEDMVIHSQKQASYATEQNEFSINTYQDIMTSIAGEALDESKAVRVSGRDSLLVTVEMDPSELYEKLNIQAMNIKNIFRGLKT